jgi:hypothetical protein
MRGIYLLPRHNIGVVIGTLWIEQHFNKRGGGGGGGGADKPLARPGRKKATATKLGMYSTHSQ